MHQLTKQTGKLPVPRMGEGPINLFNFGVNDHWIWWNQNPNQSGICDGPAYPGGYGSDAAEEIQKKVHLRKGVPNGNYSYINPVVLFADPSEFPNPGSTTPNYLSAFLFDNFSTSPGFHYCLDPTEMNFYLNGAERIIYNTPPIGKKPQGLSFVNVDMQGSMILLPGNGTEILHVADITYATLVTNPDPPEDL